DDSFGYPDQREDIYVRIVVRSVRISKPVKSRMILGFFVPRIVFKLRRQVCQNSCAKSGHVLVLNKDIHIVVPRDETPMTNRAKDTASGKRIPYLVLFTHCVNIGR